MARIVITRLTADACPRCRASFRRPESLRGGDRTPLLLCLDPAWYVAPRPGGKPVEAPTLAPLACASCHLGLDDLAQTFVGGRQVGGPSFEPPDGVDPADEPIEPEDVDAILAESAELGASLAGLIDADRELKHDPLIRLFGGVLLETEDELDDL